MIELINININKKYIRINLNKVREYYARLKKADKHIAKAVLKNSKRNIIYHYINY